jgi:hypothetical protein
MALNVSIGLPLFSKQELFYLLTTPIVLFLTYKLSLELWCLTYGLFYGS